MIGEISDKILFTGAGFTKNFGGFLGTEMWSKIFNHPSVQEQGRLRELLLGDFDYESVYHRVLSGEYTKDEKDIISYAILEAYKALDDIVRKWTFTPDAPYPVNIYGVNRMIRLFARDRGKLSFFFTLNQDLFVERYFDDLDAGLTLPYVSRIPRWDGNKRQTLDTSDFVTLPVKEKITNCDGHPFHYNALHYIKLHGSYGWQSSDGSSRMVIGRDKTSQIKAEPLLAEYLTVFQEVLSSKEEVKVLIIGYGFQDEHINDALADSTQTQGMRMFVISPTDQSRFIEHLRGVPFGNVLLSGLKAYFPYSLLDIFPSDQSESGAWREIRNIYFTYQ